MGTLSSSSCLSTHQLGPKLQPFLQTALPLHSDPNCLKSGLGSG